MDRINVLVSGIGAPGGPSIIKCLKKNGERDIRVIVADMNPFVAGAYMADKFYTLINAEHPNFISNALEICQNDNVDVFIPLNTVSLQKLADHRKDFEKIGTKLLLSDSKAIEIANNKELTFEHLKKNNLPCPEYYIITNITELQDAAYKLGYPKNNVCIKPTFSHGSKGMRILREAVDKTHSFLNEKPDSSFCTLDEVVEIFENKPFPRYIVMEYLPGKEYSCDMLLNKGKTLVTIPRVRAVIQPGMTFSGFLEDNEEIRSLSDKIAVSMGLNFNINMQFRYSAKNLPQLIEINPRLSATIVMNLGAGINLPYLGIKLVLGEDVEIKKADYKIKMIRFWDEVFINGGNKSFIIQ